MSFKVGDRVRAIGGYGRIRGRCGTVVNILRITKNTKKQYVKFDTVERCYNVRDKYLVKIGSFGIIQSFRRIYRFSDNLS